MSAISNAVKQDIESAIVAAGVIDPQTLSELRTSAEEAGKPFLSHLIDKGAITDEQLTQYTAQAMGIDYMNLAQEGLKIKKEHLDLIDRDTAERFMSVAIGREEGRVAVAMLDASNIQAIDFLSTKIGSPIKVYKASEAGIRKIISQYEAKLNNGVVNRDKKKSDGDGSADKSKEAIEKDGLTVTKTIDSLIKYAIEVSASDIHIEPNDKDIAVRIRVDGVLREVMRLPKYSGPALITRVKILSRLKIDEHRVPQDGQASFTHGSRRIDLRVAISPVIWGEQVVIRLLDKGGISLKLEDMGYAGPALAAIRRGMQRPNGMILTSGPTGSGKSTSMYAILSEIKNEKINIITLEDPVEYKMEGINQIQINTAVGLTFASGLRSVLRLDPDVVMVGEIRDKETAQLAVQAALTGHLVLSTVHTNSAAGVLPRLVDMGIEPFLIASTVNVVIGQRLIRRNNNPLETYNATPKEVAAINENLGRLLPKDASKQDEISKHLGYAKLPLLNDDSYILANGSKDRRAPDGYKGRAGLYEVFEVNEAIERLILKRAPSSEVMAQAKLDGTVSMREDGYLKALAGITTVEEVNRVTALNNS